MQKYFNIISSTILFKGFTDQEVHQALSCLEGSIRDFNKKEIIFRKEDVLDAVGIILHGQVLLCKENVSGMRFIFSELVDGDIVGRLPCV